MTEKEFNRLKFGVYRIYWTKEAGGGSSVAAIGGDYTGRRWVAPANWTGQTDEDGVVAVAHIDQHELIERVEFITRV